MAIEGYFGACDWLIDDVTKNSEGTAAKCYPCPLCGIGMKYDKYGFCFDCLRKMGEVPNNEATETKEEL